MQINEWLHGVTLLIGIAIVPKYMCVMNVVYSTGTITPYWITRQINRFQL